MLTYPIPQKSAKAYTEHRGKGTQNPGLVFERFVPDTLELPSDVKGQEPPKKQGLNAVIAAAEKADSKLLENWNTRWKETVKCDGAIPFPLKTQWRFISGMGRKGTLEVGFTFNRYGFPYLPGSSVKGIARAAALIKLAESLDKKLELLQAHLMKKANIDDVKKLPILNALEMALLCEKDDEFVEDFGKCNPDQKQRIDAENFRMIFGNTAKAGWAVFFDAIPDSKGLPKLELDILNPHYPDYYKEKSTVPPADWQNPVPTYFLTVAKDVTFLFAIGWRGKSNEELRGQAENWLKYGLEKLGAGAKTSAGYGYFEKPEKTS